MRKVSEFDQLYQKYYKDIYYYLKTLSQDETIAEDLTAETFLQVYKNIHKFRGECDIRKCRRRRIGTELWLHLRNSTVDIQFRKAKIECSFGQRRPKIGTCWFHLRGTSEQ